MHLLYCLNPKHNHYKGLHFKQDHYFCNMENIQRKVAKPDWLKIQLPNTADYSWMNKTIRDNKLHTICTSGKCPNAAECWSNGTATFMILGDICTRSCKFCNVKTGKPDAPDTKEPMRIARSIQIMKLRHAVITSVDRDDLEDGGVITSYSIHYTKLYDFLFVLCLKRRLCVRNLPTNISFWPPYSVQWMKSELSFSH